MMCANKRGQQILYGGMLMMFIFFMAVLLVINYLFVNPAAGGDEFSLYQRESVRAADALVSSGYPDDWDTMSDVMRLGLVDDGLLNRTKFMVFAGYVTASEENYQRAKQFLGLQHEYMVIIETVGLNQVVTSPARPQTESDLIASAPRIITTQKRHALYDNAGSIENVLVKVIVYSD